MLAAALVGAPLAGVRAAPPVITPTHDPSRPLGPDLGVGADDITEEIVIIARKLRMVNVHLMRKANGSVANCTILATSGDAEVDALTCKAATTCAAQLPKRETPAETMNQCTRQEQARLVEELAEKRIQEELNN